MTKKKKQTLKFTYNYCNDPKDKGIDTYVGEIKEGIMHGKGKYTTHTGSKYVGTFKNGKVFKGTWFFDSGDTNWEQTGTFKIFLDKQDKSRDFEIIGIGTMKQTSYTLNNNPCHPLDADEIEYDYYKGTFISGCNIHGKGEQTLYSDKKFSKKISSYKGNFVEYSYEGDGEYTEYDKNNKWIRKLIGKFKDNNLPKGTYIDKYKDEIFEYKGELKYISGSNNFATPHGKGTMKHSFLKEKAYVLTKGTWVKGLPEGKNHEIYFRNKNFTSKFIEYKGDMKEAEYHGFGIRKNNNSKYEGAWKKGKKHGKGIEIFKDGIVYTGEYKDDLFEGYGILEKKKQFKHEGLFKNNYFFGFIKSMVYRDGYGEKFIQQWDENNKLISELNESNVLYLYIKDKNQFKKIIKNNTRTDIRLIRFYESSQPSIFNSNFNKIISTFSGLALSIVFDNFKPSDNLHKYFSKMISLVDSLADGKWSFCDMPDLYFDGMKLTTNKNILEANNFVINLIKSIYLNSVYVVDEDYINEGHWEGDFTLKINDKEVFSSSVFNKKINKKDIIKIHEIEDYNKSRDELKILLNKYLSNLDFKKYFSNFSKKNKTNSINLLVNKWDTQARFDYYDDTFNLEDEWKKINS